MIILGLAGQARAGKNTIADYLEKHYGFIQFAFSDALYYEVQQAFGLPDQSLLRDAATKDSDQPLMCLDNCTDPEFVTLATTLLDAATQAALGDVYALPGKVPLKPRNVLQWWGTEYRRAQDPDYWVRRAQEFIVNIVNATRFPEQTPQFFVETGTRYENERAWIHSTGGNVWHVHRDGLNAPGQGHSSAIPLPVIEPEREIWNNDTVTRLFQGVDILLRTGNQFVKVEPMLPDVEPAADETCPVAGRIQ